MCAPLSKNNRKSKKDHKYFTDNLKCAILKVKRDKSVVYVRRPKGVESDYIAVDRGQSSSHLASKSEDFHGYSSLILLTRCPDTFQLIHINLYMLLDYIPRTSSYNINTCRWPRRNDISDVHLLNMHESKAAYWTSKGIHL